MSLVPELVHPLDSRISLESDLTELDLVCILDSLTPIELRHDRISILDDSLVTRDLHRE